MFSEGQAYSTIPWSRAFWRGRRRRSSEIHNGETERTETHEDIRFSGDQVNVLNEARAARSAAAWRASGREREHRCASGARVCRPDAPSAVPTCESGTRAPGVRVRPLSSPCAFVVSVPPFVALLRSLRSLRVRPAIIQSVGSYLKGFSCADVSADRSRLLACAVLVSTVRRRTAPAAINIPFERYTLPNGLTVILLAGSRDADRSRQCLVPRRIEERDARADRFRAPLRARHVHRFRPRALRAPRQAHRGRRRNQQRHDLERSDDLLRDRPVELSSSRRCGSKPIAWDSCSIRSTSPSSTRSATS